MVNSNILKTVDCILTLDTYTMSDRDIYIHVGLPKTATTFLQTEIFPQLPILYTDHKRSNFEESLRIEEVHHLHSTSQYAVNETFTARVEEQLQSLFSETERRRLLISDESLVGGWYINYLSGPNIQQMLSHFFPEATILITIRRQDTFLKSLYATSLSNGNPLTFHQFMNYRGGSFGQYQRISPPNIDIRTLNWNAVVESYENHFGQENVFVVPFELIHDSVKSYIQAITSPLGVSLPR